MPATAPFLRHFVQQRAKQLRQNTTFIGSSSGSTSLPQSLQIRGIMERSLLPTITKPTLSPHRLGELLHKLRSSAFHRFTYSGVICIGEALLLVEESIVITGVVSSGRVIDCEDWVPGTFTLKVSG